MFVLNEHTHLVLIPTGGIGWVIGDREVARTGVSEGALGIGAGSDAEVDEIVGRAWQAGATVAMEPGAQPWAYAASFADPDGHVWTVTSSPLPT